MNDVVIANVGKITIPTYPSPAAEEMPMFAENRVHQRTSGNPYPNHIVQRVDREKKTDQEHVCIRLENRYLKLEILPAFGGRIYSALDKTTGYDFIYKNHVIKPALIGCLGSWLTGGMEFNWPFHHRPSSFMPTDYHIERCADGTAIVWLSEHEPFDRMKGMVGICLKPNEAIFETRMKLANRTPLARSFMWWENCAVPANRDYQIFFPRDVNHVHFHYKRSVTTFPIASNAMGVYNGIRYPGDTDISMHKNTIQPTSYFSAASKYDFFGGFDHAKKCGIVHVSSHHTSSGKKMFTWAYNQLSTAWENAMTDTVDKNGNKVIINAELMAGSYSDNQPDFSWIEPYETKSFSQFWFPIGNVGIPLFANQNGAIAWNSDKMVIQVTRDFGPLKVTIGDGQKTLREETFTLGLAQCKEIDCGLKQIGFTVRVMHGDSLIMAYTEERKEIFGIPDPIEDMPNHKTVKTAQELYLEGVHVWQYRDPAVSPDVYWKEALQRDGEHLDSLLAMGEFCFKGAFYAEALAYVQKALDVVTKYNRRPRSGRIYYQLGLIHDKMGNPDTAYDLFHKASWNMDCYSAAMTQICAIDGRRNNFRDMAEHSANALRYNTENPIASVYHAIAQMKLGNQDLCIGTLDGILSQDPLNHLARYISARCGKMQVRDFYEALRSDPSQTCLDIAFDLMHCGLEAEARDLLEGVSHPSPMVHYVRHEYEKAGNVELRSAFPFRLEEYAVLQRAVAENPGDAKAHYYLGCLLYSKGHFAEGAQCFQASIDRDPTFYIPYRNVAVANYSHLNRPDQVLPLLRKALQLRPGDYQLVFEIAYVMSKYGLDPAERIAFVTDNTVGKMEENVCRELARAYVQNGEPEKAIALYDAQTFVACEGGEHQLVEPYMFAHHLMGRQWLKQQNYQEALSAFRSAQVLPQNLGSGLWNEVKLVPHQYFEAQCLDALGQKEKAEQLYRHILGLTVDYFTIMHLKELPYYLALCHRRMGDELKGRMVMDKHLKSWKQAEVAADAGYYATTPFFISYCDDPAKLRTANYRYLIGLAKRFAHDHVNASADLVRSAELDPYNLYYKLESEL